MSGRGLALRPALKLCTVRAGGAAVRLSPRLARKLAPVVGDAARLLNTGARRRVNANLRGLLPDATEAEIAAACRGVFRSVALYYVELMSLPVTDVVALERRADVAGYEWVERLLAEGRGIVLTGIHCGPSELVLQGFAARGVRYTALIERLQPPQVNDYLRAVRESNGHRYVFPDVDGVKELIRVLRGGGVVALLVDRDVLGTGIPATFCGREIRAPAGAIELAALTGAPILPATVYWRADGRYEVAILPPLRVDRRARKGDALRREVERLLAAFEPHLRAHPDQWLVLERYWRD